MQGISTGIMEIFLYLLSLQKVITGKFSVKYSHRLHLPAILPSL